MHECVNAVYRREAFVAAAALLFVIAVLGWSGYRLFEANKARQAVIEQCFGKEAVSFCEGDLYQRALRECTNDTEEGRN